MSRARNLNATRRGGLAILLTGLLVLTTGGSSGAAGPALAVALGSKPGASSGAGLGNIVPLGSKPGVVSGSDDNVVITFGSKPGIGSGTNASDHNLVV